MDEKKYTNAKSCDRFGKPCNANVCPLEPEWEIRPHLKGERICFYMIEAVKVDAEALFEGRGRKDLYKTIHELMPLITARHRPIKKALESAKTSGSRMAREIGK